MGRAIGTWLFVLFATGLATVSAKGGDRVCPTDQYVSLSVDKAHSLIAHPRPQADPANDQCVRSLETVISDRADRCSCNPLRYVPNEAINALAAALYFIVAIALTYSEFRSLTSCSRIVNYRWRANYMLCLVIGAYCEGLGLAMRLALRNNLHSQGIYIVMYLFVVLSVGPTAWRLPKPLMNP